MAHKQTVLLKLTGEIFSGTENKDPRSFIDHLAVQLKSLSNTHRFGIVIGGGNIFRGDQQGNALQLMAQTGHQCGMLATIINGLILQDILQQGGLSTSILSAFVIPQISSTISPTTITENFYSHDCLIFTAGTGNPYFSTDTAAVLRALQINAQQIWKGTKVDGIYTDDPGINVQAQLLKKIRYSEALEKNLAIMDSTALCLAQQHALDMRVFNIFHENALIQAADDKAFGSFITN